MFTSSKSRFEDKEDKIDILIESSKRKPVKAQFRRCRKCGSPMNIEEHIRTIYIVFPVPGLKYKYKCTNCSKEIIIRSSVRFISTIIFAAILIAVAYPMIRYEVQNIAAGIYAKSDLPFLIIFILIISACPILIIAEVYRRKRYPVLES